MVTQPGYGAAGIGTQGPALGQVTTLPLSPQGPGRSLNTRVLYPHLVQGTKADRDARGPREKRCERQKGAETQQERETETDTNVSPVRWQERGREALRGNRGT